MARKIKERADCLVDETIFSNGSAHFNALLNDIRAAKHTICLETYIFKNDALGQRVANALCDAARQGVHVRVLVDGAGSPYWTTSFAKKLEACGVKTKVFHPFPWQLWNWSRSFVEKPLLLKIIYLCLKVNSRNHRKMCLIDSTIAYIGSFNISQCHLSIEDGGENWRDTSVRLCGRKFHEIQKAFDMAWSHRSIKERLREAFAQIRKDPGIRLNYSRHRRRILYKNLLRRMRLCQQRIWITNAYFVPDNFLLKRLREAAHQGIDVRILLPNKSDVMMMPWASSSFYVNLLKDGVKIYEYLPSMLHAKSLILDDWCLIGSSNLNHRSLLHDLEVDVTLFSDHAKKTMELFFLDDLSHSEEITLDNWKIKRPFLQRFLGRLFLYLKYWI